MKKRILSLIASVVLILVAVIGLQNEKVVETADDLVLLEKRHPDYFNNFIRNSYTLDNENSTVNVMLVSKKDFSELNFSDLKILFNRASNDSQSTYIVDFVDGTGVVLNGKSASYCNITENDSVISVIDSIVTNKNYYSLSSSNENESNGINGIPNVSTPGNIDIAKITNLYKYLISLKSKKYTIFISAKDDASSGWNDYLITLFNGLGLKGNLTGKYRYSYLAISSEGQAIDEQLNDAALSSEGSVNGIDYVVKSAGAGLGEYSAIVLNDESYSKNNRGLNIVVCDGTQVVDSVNFDTFDNGFPCKR